MEADKEYTRVKAELDDIWSSHGQKLRPKDIVEYAKDESTALHSRFEWDDTVAGYEYRLHQARKIVGSYSAPIVIPGSRESIMAPVYLSPHSIRGKDSYKTVHQVMSDEELRAEMLASALAELRRLKQRYAILKELAGVFSALDKVK